MGPKDVVLGEPTIRLAEAQDSVALTGLLQLAILILAIVQFFTEALAQGAYPPRSLPRRKIVRIQVSDHGLQCWIIGTHGRLPR